VLASGLAVPASDLVVLASGFVVLTTGLAVVVIGPAALPPVSGLAVSGFSLHQAGAPLALLKPPNDQG
jgi:hypothetical protein